MKDFLAVELLLDRSGSMNRIKKRVITGFNTFLKQQQEYGDNASLTLVQFDSDGIDDVYVETPIREVAELSDKNFIPRGSTPLLEAAIKTITKTGERLAAKAEEDRPDKVVFVFITDGEENASGIEYTKDVLRNMIEHQHDVYNWQFIYLGANQDAFAEASSYGIPMAGTANFVGVNADVAYAAMSSNFTEYRGSGQATSLNWTDAQRSILVDETDNSSTAGAALAPASPPTTPPLPKRRRK